MGSSDQKGSLLDRTANRAKMLTERDACVTATRRDVLVESSLLPEGRAELHACRLMALRVADAYRKLGYRAGLANRNKQNAIIVPQHKISCRDDMLAESCGRKRARIHRVEALRSGRQGSQTKDRQANDAELSRIPMQTPDHDAGQARAAGFQCNQITNARLIQSATVIDHQNVARCCTVYCLQEYINTAIVAHRVDAAAQMRTAPQWARVRGRAAHLDP